MKKYILASVSAITLGTSAFAAPTQPNLFECRADGIDVGYTTSSIVGKPTFQLKAEGNPISRTGDEITTVKSAAGTLVTVQVRYVPDHSTELATLVVPTIHLTKQLGEVKFTTALIRTTARTSIAGPGLVSGVVNPSQYKAVTCTAKRVFF